MNMRFIHHFTIAEIGTLVTYRPHPNSLIYELCLPGKIGIIQAIENRFFDQQLTVDFNYLLKFNQEGKKRMTLSPWVVVPKGYQSRWLKGQAPKHDPEMVLSVGDVLSREQVQKYNAHFQSWERLRMDDNPRVTYTVIKAEVAGPLPDTEGSVVVEYEDPANSIGPTWKVSGDNLAPLPTAWVPPELIKRADATEPASLTHGGYPQRLLFCYPPSVNVASAHTPTTKARGDNLYAQRKARAF